MKKLFLIIYYVLLLHVSAEVAYDGKDIGGIAKILLKKPYWRKEASRRIDQLRRANIHIKVTDKQGQPVEGVQIHVNLKKHAFIFGGVVSVRNLQGKIDGVKVENYKRFALSAFNQVGFNNALKYKLKKYLEPYLPEAFEWLEENNMPCRGHTLIWPGWDHMHRDARDLKNDPDALREFCEIQIRDYARKWNVVEWDVLNEPRGNHDLQDIFGNEIMLDWFHLAKKNVRNKKALLYLNENRVVSAPPGKENYIDQYIKTAKFLKNNGAPLTALGVQSRFRWDCPADIMYERLELLREELELPISATEFEIIDNRNKTWEEVERAEMTLRVMTTYFSHPSVRSLIAWSVVSGREHKNSGLIHPDGTLKLNGKVWLFLTRKRWHTSKTLETNAKGQALLRGFKGSYEYFFPQKDTRDKGHFILDQDKTLEIQL